MTASTHRHAPVIRSEQAQVGSEKRVVQRRFSRAIAHVVVAGQAAHPGRPALHQLGRKVELFGVGLAVQRDVAQVHGQVGREPLDGACGGMPVRHALGRAWRQVAVRDQGDAHGPWSTPAVVFRDLEEIHQISDRRSVHGPIGTVPRLDRVGQVVAAA